MKNSPNTSTCISLLDSFQLKQHVDIPTHISGHTIDLVITRNEDPLVDTPIAAAILSDHFAIQCSYQLHRLKEKKRIIKYHKLKGINIERFQKAQNTFAILTQKITIWTPFMDRYNYVLQNALDKDAHALQKRAKTATVKPWADDEVLIQRNMRRKLERRWKKTQSSENPLRFKAQRNYVNEITDKKKIFFNEAILNKDGDQKALYSLVKGLTNKPTDIEYPEASGDAELSNTFSDFLKSKIEKINYQFSPDTPSETAEFPSRSYTTVFYAFPSLSTDDIQKYILSSPSKSCRLDPILTFLLKKCLNQVLPTITTIVNDLLSTGCMLSSLKQAVIAPITPNSQKSQKHRFK